MEEEPSKSSDNHNDEDESDFDDEESEFDNQEEDELSNDEDDEQDDDDSNEDVQEDEDEISNDEDEEDSHLHFANQHKRKHYSTSELFSRALNSGPSITANGQLSASQIWGDDDTEALRFAGLVKKKGSRRRRHKRRKTNRMYRKELPPELTSILEEGTTLWLEGKTSEAIEKLTSVANQAPKSNLPYLQLGIVYDQLDEQEKALEMFSKATALAADDVQSLQRVAELAISLGKRKLAISSLSKLIRRDPENKQKWIVERAEQYSVLGAFKRAQEEYEAVLEMDPHNTRCMVQHALQHELKGNREGALFELTDIVQCVLFPFRMPLTGTQYAAQTSGSASGTNDQQGKADTLNETTTAWVIDGPPEAEDMELGLRLGAFRQLVEILLKAKQYEKASGLIVRVNKFLQSGDSAQNRSVFMWSWQAAAANDPENTRPRSGSIAAALKPPVYHQFKKRPLPLDIAVSFATCSIYTDNMAAGSAALEHLKTANEVEHFDLLLQVGTAMTTMEHTKEALEIFSRMEHAVELKPDLGTWQFWLEYGKLLLCSVLPRSTTIFEDDPQAVRVETPNEQPSVDQVRKKDTLERALKFLDKAKVLAQAQLTKHEEDAELQNRYRRVLVAELLQPLALIASLQRAGKRGYLPQYLDTQNNNIFKRRKQSFSDANATGETGSNQARSRLDSVSSNGQGQQIPGRFWQEPPRKRGQRMRIVGATRDNTTKRRTREALEAIELQVDQFAEQGNHEQVVKHLLPLFQYLLKSDPARDQIPNELNAQNSEVGDLWQFAKSVNIPIQWEHQYDGHVFSALGEERAVRMVTMACKSLLALGKIESAFTVIQRVLEDKARKASRFVDSNLFNILELMLSRACFYNHQELVNAYRAIFMVIQRATKRPGNLPLAHTFELLNYALLLSKSSLSSGEGKNFVRQLERLHKSIPEGFNKRALDLLLGNFFMPTNPVRAIGKLFACLDKEYPNPVVLLGIVQCYCHMVFNRKATSRRKLVVKSLQWLGEYAQARLKAAHASDVQEGATPVQVVAQIQNATAEIEFNTARAYHELGMEFMAVAHYQKVLGMKGLDGEETLKREAAHNLVIILRNRNDHQGAYQIVRRYLTV